MPETYTITIDGQDYDVDWNRGTAPTPRDFEEMANGVRGAMAPKNLSDAQARAFLSNAPTSAPAMKSPALLSRPDIAATKKRENRRTVRNASPVSMEPTIQASPPGAVAQALQMLSGAVSAPLEFINQTIAEGGLAGNDMEGPAIHFGSPEAQLAYKLRSGITQPSPGQQTPPPPQNFWEAIDPERAKQLANLPYGMGGVARFVQNLLTPANLLPLGAIVGSNATAQKLLAGAFGAPMAYQGTQQVGEGIAHSDTNTAVEGILNALLGAAGVAHATPKPAPRRTPVTPEQARAYQQAATAEQAAPQGNASVSLSPSRVQGDTGEGTLFSLQMPLRDTDTRFTTPEAQFTPEQAGSLAQRQRALTPEQEAILSQQEQAARQAIQARQKPQETVQPTSNIVRLTLPSDGSPALIARQVDPALVDFKSGDGSAKTKDSRAISMVDTLSKGGKLSPPILTLKEDGRFQVYDGNARVTAYKQTGTPFDAIINYKASGIDPMAYPEEVTNGNQQQIGRQETASPRNGAEVRGTQTEVGAGTGSPEPGSVGGVDRAAEVRRGEVSGIGGEGQKEVTFTPEQQAYINRARINEQWIPTDQIAANPDVFQFRRRTVADFPSWNEKEAAKNPISVWRDVNGELGTPGQVYAVNGHHRFANAEKFGVPMMRARFMDADNAATAREMGAIENLLDSPRNDALDVAHFLRNTALPEGGAAEFLRQNGIGTQARIMRDAVAMSRLPENVFEQVYQHSDQIPGLKSMAAAVGEHFPNPKEASAQFADLFQKMRDGQKITPEFVAERARILKEQQAATQQSGMDFDFGDVDTRARVVTAVKKHFDSLIRSGKGLSRQIAENFYNVTGEQRGKADLAAQIGEVIDRTAHGTGPLGSRITETVNRIAQGADEHAETRRLATELESGNIIGDTLNAWGREHGATDSARNSVPEATPAKEGHAPADLFGSDAATSQPQKLTPPTKSSRTARLDAIEDAARARLKKNLGKLTSGVDPQDLADMATIGAVKLARGIVNASAWAAEMVKEFGEEIKPYLGNLWEMAHRVHDEEIAPQINRKPLRKPAEASKPAEPAVTPTERIESPAPENSPNGGKSEPLTSKAANAHAETERASLNLSALPETERKPVAEAWQKSLDENRPTGAKALAESVIQNPRNLSDVETASIVQRMQQVKERIEAIRKAPDAELPALKAEHDALLSEYDTLDQARKIVGREWARSGLARQVEINQYDYVGAIQRAKLANPEKPVPAEMQKRIETLTQRLADVEAKLAEKEKAPAERQNRSAQGTPVGFGEKNKVFTKEKADAARQRLQKKLGTLNAGFDPTMLADLAEIGGYYLEGGMRTFTEWAAQMRQDVSQKLDDETLQHVWDTVTGEKKYQSKLKGYKTRLQRQIEEMNAQIASGNPQKATRTPLTLDREAIELKAQRDLLKAQIDSMIEAREPKGFLQRFTGLHREMILSGPSVFGKLLGATAWGMPTETAADLLGAFAGKVTGLGKVAEREGRFSPKGEVAGYRALISREALANAKQTITTGMNAIDALAGQKPHAAELGGYVGRIHGAEKSFYQTAQYQKSLQTRLEIAAKRGLDVTDPEVQAQIGVAAAMDAMNAKFQGSNAFTDALNRAVSAWEKSPSVGVRALGAFFRTLAPITRVPANIAGRAIDMTGVGVARGLGMQIAETMKAKKAGTEIPPEVADKILRAYKYGGFGLMTAYIGLTQPAWFKSSGFFAQKEEGNPDSAGKPLKFGNVEVGGRQVPKLMAHSPLIEAIQFWATMRRGMERHGATGGAMQAAIGVAKQAPGLESTARIVQGLEGPDKMQKAGGEYARGLVIPQAVQQVAAMRDKDANGEPIKRSPKGFTDQMKMGIPGLRQTVPEKGSGGKSFEEKLAESLTRRAKPRLPAGLR